MATPAPPPAPKVRNPRTQALHRREAFWQILLPLALAIAAALTLMVFVGLGAAALARTSALADVSLMFLILIAGVGGLAGLALLAGLNFGIGYALRELPYLFKRAQDVARRVEFHTKRIAAPLAEGVLSVESIVAAAQRAAASLRSIVAPEG